MNKFGSIQKVITLLFLIMTLFACNDDGHNNPESDVSIEVSAGDVTNFPTVGFEQVAEVEIPFSVDEVFPLFQPEGRSHLYSWWNPSTVLREAISTTLNGLVTFSQVEAHEIYLVVTDYDADNKYIQYLVLWDDFELQRIDITCEQGTTANSTKVIWTERNAGIHDNGVSMVSDFVNGNGIVTSLQQYGRSVEEYLQMEINGMETTSVLEAISQGDAINFSTVGFEQTVEAEILCSVDEVFPLFEPEERNLLYSWWNSTSILREATGNTLDNLVTVSQPDDNDPLDVFLIVTNHDPDNNYIQYLVLWDDFELQRIDITCEQGTTAGSTKVIWKERNAGIHENGASMVTQFIESEGLVNAVARYFGEVSEQCK